MLTVSGFKLNIPNCKRSKSKLLSVIDKDVKDVPNFYIEPIRLLPVMDKELPKLYHEPVYLFGKDKDNSMSPKKEILGGKGTNLAIMSSIGLSVPPGLTITTEVCSLFHKNGRKMSQYVWDKTLENLKEVEKEMKRSFGHGPKPLLLSVRSGAAISMPGMMDTILNLGINDDTVKELANEFGDRFAMDSYRRFINMFGTVVLNIPHHEFEEKLEYLKSKVGVKVDNELSTEDLTVLVAQYKEVYKSFGFEFPTDPYEQLRSAVFAVFDSWNSDRAIKYREAEGITGLLGTAVTVQAMCFGNMGDTSGTGVCFTRNPNTGEKKLYGEYLINAQGEDVVAGIRTPLPIEKLRDSLPEAYDELLRNVEILESHYRDMQDIEFTIQNGHLFMLQTRSGKRVGPAAIKIANDIVDEGLASIDEAIITVKPEHLNQLLHPQFPNDFVGSATYKENLLSVGLPASPGAAVGRIVFTPAEAEALFAAGQACILVRDDTSPEDVGGMWASQGVLTARGGMTSHAAVVARGWGKPCICGCDDLKIDYEAGTVTFYSKGSNAPVVLREKDWISLNGDTGEVLKGQFPLNPPSIESSTDIVRFMKWIDLRRSIKVMANADTPADAMEARRNGAQGIGLVRTEHMFFADDRIRVVRRMILSKNENKEKALAELLELQRQDFEGILEAMDGLPVTVRLLDPPLHEFLPAVDSIDDGFAQEAGMSKEECIYEVNKLQEVNPMLGLRGCRLGIVMPELVKMQARALIEAALNNKYNKKLNPVPEIMIPLVGSATEFTHQADIIRSTIEQVFKERQGQSIDYKLGTMIEVPRAALTAEEIVKAGAEFFSYGTNDLTQMTFGFSRDDIGSYLPTYLKKGILDKDPFQVIDEKGVGLLVKNSAEVGKTTAYALARERGSLSTRFKAGVCGEHGGDPTSVRFFVRSGLDYVSCSPFRVPVARLAAAQANLEMKR